jgi:hypothetical protein
MPPKPDNSAVFGNFRALHVSSKSLLVKMRVAVQPFPDQGTKIVRQHIEIGWNNTSRFSLSLSFFLRGFSLFSVIRYPAI